jgi:general secretion pathway protein G
MKFLLLSFILMVSEAAFAASSFARVTAARADIDGGIKTALVRFNIDCGRYPTTSEGFAALMNCPTNISRGRWRGPYLDQIPIDPWGNVYVYCCPGIHNTNGFDLYSCGFDGISKSGGDDPDNINNWDSKSPHGGKDYGLNSNQWLLFRFENSLAYHVFLLILAFVPFARFFPRVRAFIDQHPTARFVWFVLLLAAILLLLSSLVPRIS